MTSCRLCCWWGVYHAHCLVKREKCTCGTSSRTVGGVTQFLPCRIVGLRSGKASQRRKRKQRGDRPFSWTSVAATRRQLLTLRDRWSDPPSATEATKRLLGLRDALWHHELWCYDVSDRTAGRPACCVR